MFEYLPHSISCSAGPAFSEFSSLQQTVSSEAWDHLHANLFHSTGIPTSQGLTTFSTEFFWVNVCGGIVERYINLHRSPESISGRMAFSDPECLTAFYRGFTLLCALCSLTLMARLRKWGYLNTQPSCSQSYWTNCSENGQSNWTLPNYLWYLWIKIAKKHRKCYQHKKKFLQKNWLKKFQYFQAFQRL